MALLRLSSPYFRCHRHGSEYLGTRPAKLLVKIGEGPDPEFDVFFGDHPLGACGSAPGKEKPIRSTGASRIRSNLPTIGMVPPSPAKTGADPNALLGVPHWGSRLSGKGTRPSYQILFRERRFNSTDVCGPALVPPRGRQ